MDKSGEGFGIDRKGLVTGDVTVCWLCRRSVSARALFCHACGSLQPVRGLDHFARLGLMRRFDLDLAALDKQYEGFRRALDPQRFAIKGSRERSHAAQQADALTTAYLTLREPVKRAAYLLELNGIEPNGSGGDAGADTGADTGGATDAADGTGRIGALEEALAQATDFTEIDRLGNRIRQDIEVSIYRLSAAFRSEDLPAAQGELERLKRLEAVASAARERRAAFKPETGRT